MGFFDDLYDNTIGKAVDTAKNLWVAGTTPTTGNIIQATQQAADIYKGLSTPETKAVTEQKVTQLKSPESIAKAQAEINAKNIAIGKEITSMHPDIWGMAGKQQPTTLEEAGQALLGKAPDLPGGSTIATPEARALREAQREAAEQKEFESSPAALQRIMQWGGALRAGLIGVDQPEYQTKSRNLPWSIENAPAKIADLVTNLSGLGVGFWAGGEITGASKVAGAAVKGAEKLIPFLATEAGQKILPRVASAFVKGAIRGGVESELLSGIHSVLNSDTKEKALSRAKEYGLMGVFAGGAIGAGLTFLGAVAKKLKGVVKTNAPVEKLKGHTEEVIEPYREIKPNEHYDSSMIVSNIKNADQNTILMVGKMLKSIVDHQEKYPPRMVGEAKMSLVDLHDKLDYMARNKNKIETSGELFPEIEQLKNLADKITEAGKKQRSPARKNLDLTQLSGKKKVDLKGQYGEHMRVTIEPVENKPGEFWVTKANGERFWGKDDYWTAKEVAPKKVKSPKEVVPKGEAKEKVAPKVKEGKEKKLKTPKAEEDRQIDKVKRLEQKLKDLQEGKVIELESKIPENERIKELKTQIKEERKKLKLEEVKPKEKVAKKTKGKTGKTGEAKLKSPKAPKEKAPLTTEQKQAAVVKRLESKLKGLTEGKTPTGREKIPETEQIKDLKRRIREEREKMPKLPTAPSEARPTRRLKTPKSVSETKLQEVAREKKAYEFIDTTPIKETMERPSAPAGKKATRKEKKAISEYAMQERTSYSGKENINISLANELARKISKLKVKGEDEALLRYLDAGGERLSVEEVKKALQKMLDEVTGDSKIAKEKRTSIEKAMNLSDEAKTLAKKAKQFFDEHKDYSKELKIKSGLESRTGIGDTNLPQFFETQRKYESYHEGELAGESKATVNRLSEIIDFYGKQRAEIIAKTEFLNQSTLFKKVKLNENAPDGYSIIANDKFNSIAAPTYMADKFRVLFSEGWITKEAKSNKFVNAFVNTQTFIRQNKLSLDFYTHFDMYLNHVANTMFGIKRILGSKKVNAETLNRLNLKKALFETSRYIKNDVPAFKEIKHILIRDGGLITQTVKRGVEFVEPKVLGSKKLGQWEQKQMEWVFGKKQEYFKVNDAWSRTQTWLSKNPLATEAQYLQKMRQICTDVNDAYKGLNLKALNVSETFMDVAKVINLAPEWKLAGLRVAGKAIPQALKGDFTPLANVATSAVIFGLIGQLINIATTGHSTFGNDEGRELDTQISPNVYISLIPSGIKDIAKLLNKTIGKGLSEKSLTKGFVGVSDWLKALINSPVLSPIVYGSLGRGISKKETELSNIGQFTANLISIASPLALTDGLKAFFSGDTNKLAALFATTGIVNYIAPSATSTSSSKSTASTKKKATVSKLKSTKKKSDAVTKLKAKKAAAKKKK